MITSSKSIEACASYYGSESESVKNYLIDYNLDDLSI